ncbi:MAG: tRNA uridine-5-carboxymethylaminomethyl(34) synthesis GTPase MnmE [Candidatus Aminicenantes bacterium]|nr:tRNA uridine-5-carboxymethylaminomethyl(34) synthesis GTPase MnmE [Candidatus Aminicenantes bacterium]
MIIQEIDLTKTIIAIATPPGQSALGIIRLSGPKALEIAMKIFRAKTELKAWSLVQGTLIDFEKDEAFDEATAVYFPAPRSYTREDMVEIICHGSPIILEEVVRLGLKAGARLAHPGEFTLRAYLHGRIDLLQAEAVNDLIRATSLTQARLSYGQLSGRLSKKIDSLRKALIDLLSQVEAAIEFPDEGLQINLEEISRKIKEIVREVDKLIQSHDLGQAMMQGLTLALVGRANVGKSTLFNALLEKERAIVSPYPGTTRDYLEERIKIGEFLFKLIDMAGLGQPGHPVEEEGIRRGQALASQAQGLLVILDNSQPISQDDYEILGLAQDKKAILVINKIDLPSRLERRQLENFASGKPIIEVSALHKTNLDKLRKAMLEVFPPAMRQDHEEVIFHWREKVALERIKEALTQACEKLEAGYSEEIVAEELRPATEVLGQLTGEIKSEEIINAIFQEFCLGK